MRAVHCSNRRARLVSLVASGFFMMSAAIAAQPPVAKLDATLRLLSEQPAAALRIFADELAGADSALKSKTARMWPITIRLSDSADPEAAIAAMRGAGVVVRSRFGTIIVADAPIDALVHLAAFDEILQLETSRAAPLRLNVSVPATGAASLRSGTAPNWTGLTGKGVIVGVIDDGVDFRHQDFRNADGSTRILALWDQRGANTTGTPPANFTYGGECTQAMINAAINDTPNATRCAQPSAGAHGTHVAGIAAGSGRATGAAQPAFRFTGMAPEADLLVSNSIVKTVGDGNAILDAIAWMKAKAAAANKPLVINMSFGSYFGARDGTANFETALSGAGQAGVVLVGAAGNEGDAKIRAEAPISAGLQVAFELAVPAGNAFKLESWHPGTDSYSVVVKGPGQCAATQSIGPNTALKSFETPCGLIAVSFAGPFTSNDDKQLVVNLSTGTSPLTAGAWTVTFTGDTVAVAQTPLSIVTGEDANGMTISMVNGQPFTGVTTKILTDTVAGKRVIGVASYNTNYSWTRVDGMPNNPAGWQDVHGPIGDVTKFSSRGPRRMCSNAGKCPAVMKPEITAPGAMIVAAKANDKKAEGSDGEMVEQDTVHYAQNGTSMSSPHVAGAIALLLQKSPTLTPEDVRRLLFANTKKTPLTPAVPVFVEGVDQPGAPNFAWGYGALDVAKAAAAIPSGNNVTVTVTKAGSGAGTVSSQPAGVTCGATCSGSFAAAAPLTLTAAGEAGSVFTGWLGACTGAAGCNLTPSAATAVSATFAPGSSIPKTDVDGNGQYDALSDGLLMLRYLFGLNGTTLTTNAIGPNNTRSTPADIAQHLTNVMPQLDVDGNGRVDALTDGLMLLRYMFGLRGATLINGAIGPGATRTTVAQIETYVASILK